MSQNRASRHILCYAQRLGCGGVERVLERLAGLWTERGARVTLVLGSAAGATDGEVRDGIETVVLGSDGYGALLRRVPGIVRARRPDVIFCAGNHYSAVAAWTRLRLGRACPPTVVKLSNALDRPDMGPLVRAGYSAWLRLHPRFCDALVAMSAAMAEDAARRMGMPRDRIAVIANPPARRPRVAAPVDLPAGRYLLGVGRLVAQKRWDRAIVALSRLEDRTIPLVILGEGGERAALVDLARRLGIAHRLLLAGYAADPTPAMRGAAALVLTSDFEGVPGVLREALSVGTPVVTTDSSVAIPELVRSAADGCIVPRDDGDALVVAIDAWLRPGRARPAATVDTGDPAGDYLRLFDALASSTA